MAAGGTRLSADTWRSKLEGGEYQQVNVQGIFQDQGVFRLLSTIPDREAAPSHHERLKHIQL
jgi:hypothetical protein